MTLAMSGAAAKRTIAFVGRMTQKGRRCNATISILSFFAQSTKNNDRSLDNELMGQVNLVRSGFEQIGDGGSFALTTGILARSPMPGRCAVIRAERDGFDIGAQCDCVTRSKFLLR
jgi:hypothetical protein